jgi:hypothetical protein
MTQQLQPGDSAPNGAALDLNGESAALESRWATGPTLLVLLRHFG